MESDYKKSKKLFGYFIFIILLILSFKCTGVSLYVFQKRGGKFFEFLAKMFPPDVNYISDITEPVITTVRMSVAGTVLGAVAGLFTSFFMAGNINGNRVITSLLKIIVQFFRTIPVLITALVATYIFGIGAFAGTVALFIYTWAVLAKIAGEDLESMSMHTYYALVNAGNGRIKAFIRTVLIDMIPGYLNNALYLLETNVRHASILGYVGAGGIGIILNEKISWREYDRVGMILVLLYATVILIELFNKLFRIIFLGENKFGKISKAAMWLILVILFVYSVMAINKPEVTAVGAGVVKSMVGGIIHPDTSYLFSMTTDGVLYLMFETLCIAFAGTIIGAVFAFFLSMLNSTSIVSVCLAVPVRLFIMAIRTVPVFIYGIMFIRVTGPGSFAGVLTLSMCSIGLICKRFTVAIDNLDLSAWKAYESMGIGWLKRVKRCILPQLMPQFISVVVYRFDVNIRSASVLGLVGAGGIGAPLISYMNQYRWDAAGSIIIVMFVTVMILELLRSIFIKKMRTQS